MRGIEHFPRDPELRELLSKNGFCAVARPHEEICSPYDKKELPPFVTADSALRAYQVILEEKLELLEKLRAKRLDEVTARLVGALEGLGVEGERWSDVRTRLLAWAVVALHLASGEGDALAKVPPVARKLAVDELRRIDAGGVAPSGILEGVRFRYGMLEPASFYRGDEDLGRFFRAMRWYNISNFRVASEPGGKGCSVGSYPTGSGGSRRRCFHCWR